jgi:hypothetical protein
MSVNITCIEERHGSDNLELSSVKRLQYVCRACLLIKMLMT